MEPASGNSALRESAAAFCKRCGYALLGLPGNACPECGRAFDYTDPCSFYTARQRRRKARLRWLLQISIPTGVAFAIWLLWPGGGEFARVTLVCASCGHTHITDRWQALSPRHLSIPYGWIRWEWQWESEANPKPPPTGSCPHKYDVRLELGYLHWESWHYSEQPVMTGSSASGPESLAGINGIPGRPENGRRILDSISPHPGELILSVGQISSETQPDRNSDNADH